MMIVRSGVEFHMALGYTDMRRGFDGLDMLVQESLKQDPSQTSYSCCVVGERT